MVLLISKAMEKWGLSNRRVAILCSEGRINGAGKKENMADSLGC